MLVERIDKLMSALGRDLFVVISREEAATVFLVVVEQDLIYTLNLVRRFLVRRRDDIEPCYYAVRCKLLGHILGTHR